MKYYIDIKLLSDNEISLGFIWQKVYAQMHLAMVKQKDSQGLCKVGFSFPKYGKSFPLGDILRLLAPTKEELKLLDIEENLKRFSDYVLISDIKEVPVNVETYVTFSRKQFKNSNTERLVRRQAKRKGISIDEARKNYKDFDEEKILKENKLPYININSLSTQNKMKIFIDKNIKEKATDGLFTSYGLSKVSTVPYF